MDYDQIRWLIMTGDGLYLTKFPARDVSPSWSYNRKNAMRFLNHEFAVPECLELLRRGHNVMLIPIIDDTDQRGPSS